LAITGAGLLLLLVIGAALISSNGDGYYFLRVYKDPMNPSKYKLDGKPDPAPYQLSFGGGIIWEFTNDTDVEGLKVRIENFQCDKVSVKNCPLSFFGSLTCSSGDVPLKAKKGDTKMISATDNLKTCPEDIGLGNGPGPYLWDYTIYVDTPDGTSIADPELVIVRDGLTKFLNSVKFILRSVKRVLHL
jgi:hypothetical protein